MKKILSLILSCILIFTFIPVVLNASADESTYTKTLDFDTYPTSTPEFGFQNGAINCSAGIIDYTTVDETYQNGNVMSFTNVQGWNNIGFSLGSILKGKSVKSISFDMWSKNSATLVNEVTGLGSACTGNPAIHSFFSSHPTITSTIKNYTLNFATKSDAYKTWNKACFVFKAGTNTTYYIDNFTVTFNKYVATLTECVGGDKIIYADENNKLVLPSATISGGEFAGWVTDEAPDTIIPANTEITLEKDTKFYATAAQRAEQQAPAAPVVESVAIRTITLVQNDAYQYSMDAENWQDSNVFDKLRPNTEYTVYQRLKATAIALASPASAPLKVTTADYPAGNKKYVALTFDDGPNNGMNVQILNLLKQENVPATFFMIGDYINESTKDTVQRIVNEGHQIGYHGSNGSENLRSYTLDQVKSSWNKFLSYLNAVVDYTPTVGRWPFVAQPSCWQDFNYAFMGGIGIGDSEVKPYQSIYDGVMNQLCDGRIILMHCNKGGEDKLNALADIIYDARALGYEFCTIDQLFEIQGQTKSVSPTFSYTTSQFTNGQWLIVPRIDGEVPTTPTYKLTIDGNSVSVSNNTATLPMSTKAGFIAYTDGENYYDANEKITLTKDLSLTTVAIGSVSMLEGAAIRLGKVNGMRFYTVV
ncbi:MAG: polysaccharide deacetylase family protein, partial [Clostridia bacterium]|nr:polysaccharide deacetylase family protein [Clostridia bacterium]